MGRMSVRAAAAPPTIPARRIVLRKTRCLERARCRGIQRVAAGIEWAAAYCLVKYHAQRQQLENARSKVVVPALYLHRGQPDGHTPAACVASRAPQSYIWPADRGSFDWPIAGSHAG